MLPPAACKFPAQYLPVSNEYFKKELQNPSNEFSACYAAADSLYDAYCDLVDLAISPSGSLKTYSANFGEYDQALLKYFKKLEALMPDK